MENRSKERKPPWYKNSSAGETREERRLHSGRMGGVKSFKNYGRPESRKIGNVAIIASMLISLCILTLIKAHYCPAHTGKAHAPMPLKAAIKSDIKMTTTDEIIEDEDDEGNDKLKPLSNPAIDAIKPTCYETSRRSDICQATGDIRVHGKSTTIFISPSTSNQEWKIKPYPRKNDPLALTNVKEWSLKPLHPITNPSASLLEGSNSATTDPKHLSPLPSHPCTHNHSSPAILFSLGGFTGNPFHDFTDVLIPLFITSHSFLREVHFLVSESKPWWVNKYMPIIKHLTNHDVVDTAADTAVRCYPKVTAGLDFHKELGVDPTKGPYTVQDFKKLLKKSLGLHRTHAMTEGGGGGGGHEEVRSRPRLLIISRRKSRKFTNERGMVAMATSIGFDVRVAEADVSTDVSKFARLVNSADVMVGVHGAGMTNMLFLPEGAVVVQVIPLGRLEWLARDSFKEPTKDLGIHYLEYVIKPEESTLMEEYPRDHPVLKDPYSVHKQGWDVLKAVYLDKQDVRPHLGSLRDVLLEAVKLLPPGNAAGSR